MLNTDAESRGEGADQPACLIVQLHASQQTSNEANAALLQAAYAGASRQLAALGCKAAESPQTLTALRSDLFSVHVPARPHRAKTPPWSYKAAYALTAYRLRGKAASFFACLAVLSFFCTRRCMLSLPVCHMIQHAARCLTRSTQRACLGVSALLMARVFLGLKSKGFCFCMTRRPLSNDARCNAGPQASKQQGLCSPCPRRLSAAPSSGSGGSRSAPGRWTCARP